MTTIKFLVEVYSWDLIDLIGVFGEKRLDGWLDVDWVIKAFLTAGELPREFHEPFDIPPECTFYGISFLDKFLSW